MGDTVMSITNGKFVWELEKTPEQLAEEAKKKEVEKKKQARQDAKKKKQGKADGESASNTGASKSAELAEVAGDNEEEDKPYVWGGPTLENINLDIKKGELVMVTGRVGSGKSSLLNALLGEINKLEGQVRAHAHACKRACSIVYVCQICVCCDALERRTSCTLFTPKQ